MRQLALVIGRFQFLHRFHIEILLNRARPYGSALVLLGSSLKTCDQKNPLRWELRRDMILAACDEIWGAPRSDAYNYLEDGKPFFSFAPLKDYPDSNNRWVFQVQKLVEARLEQLRQATGEDWEPVLVGVDSDESSFYLKLFPQWKSDLIELDRNLPKVSATTIRQAAFEGKLDEVSSILPSSVRGMIEKWLKTPEGKRIQEEYEASKKGKLVLAFYDKDGKLVASEHEPIFYTTDNVVVWRGHVLLIRRRSHPGKGLWALPGGFIKPKERIKVGAVRELTEETHVQFYLKGSRRKLRISPDWCKNEHVFDHPNRSLRGRTITTAYHWVIPDEYEVAIRADDDAAKAKWFPLYEVLENMNYDLFEDHQSIVAHMALGAIS